jgi:hypothetical protein
VQKEKILTYQEIGKNYHPGGKANEKIDFDTKYRPLDLGVLAKPATSVDLLLLDFGASDSASS